jgi:hypothetical protein
VVVPVSEIQLLCDACGVLIGPRDGGIWMPSESLRAATIAWNDYRAIERRRDEALERQGRFRFLTLADLDCPPLAAWAVLHYACDSAPTTEAYEISAYRAGTARALLVWTLHLHEKGWVADTNWDALVRRLLTQSGLSVDV